MRTPPSSGRRLRARSRPAASSSTPASSAARAAAFSSSSRASCVDRCASSAACRARAALRRCWRPAVRVTCSTRACSASRADEAVDAADRASSWAAAAVASTSVPHSAAACSGAGTPAACASRATSTASSWRAVVTAPAVLVRRAASQSSTALKRSVANRRCSSSPRRALSARRNCANSPCGSSTTWKNWSALMPSSGSSSAAASSMRVDTEAQLPARSSSRWTRACSVVVPAPRALGRSCAGLRVIRQRRPPRVTSSSTSVRTAGSAWSDRSRPVLPRTPGTRPNSAKPMPSSSVVLPDPVSPCSRNRPLAASRSRSTSTSPAKGPKARRRMRCGLTPTLP